MTYVLRVLGSALGPYIIGAAGLAFALTVATAGVQTFRLDHAKADLKTARAALINPSTKKTWQSEAVRDARDLGTCRSNTVALKSAVDAQNASLAALKSEGDRRARMLSDALQQARQTVSDATRRAAGLMDLKPASGDVCSRLLEVDAEVRRGR